MARVCLHVPFMHLASNDLFLPSACLFQVKTPSLKCVAFTLLLFAAAAHCHGQEVSLCITQSSRYCGGAAPPPQILEQLQAMKAPVGQTFYIIAGSVNRKGRPIVKSVTFGAAGTARFRLKAGKYSIIDSFRVNALPQRVEDFDMQCLAKVWAKPLVSFDVRKGKPTWVDHHIVLPCPWNATCLEGGELKVPQ